MFSNTPTHQHTRARARAFIYIYIYIYTYLNQRVINIMIHLFLNMPSKAIRYEHRLNSTKLKLSNTIEMHLLQIRILPRFSLRYEHFHCSKNSQSTYERVFIYES
jgi:hypothetical protein